MTDQSSTFYVNPKDEVSGNFRDFIEISSSKYTIIVKARKNGQWFALKALSEEYRGRGLYESLLRKEYDIGFRFNNPNIVRYIDFVIVDGLGSCIQMEYIVGKRLDEFLMDNPSLKIKRDIVLEIASGLSAIHAEQIIHRDLKPENIMVTANGCNAKIIDFGLSDSDSYAALKEPAGTLVFSSPEQIAGDQPLDNRADIYSLGVILKLMHLPFYYKKIIEKCCADDRNNRYADVEQFKESFVNPLWKRVLPFIILLFAILIIAVLIVLPSRESEENKRVVPLPTKTVTNIGNDVDNDKPKIQATTHSSNDDIASQSVDVQLENQVQEPTTAEGHANQTIPVDELAEQLHKEIDNIINPYIIKRNAGINEAQNDAFIHIMDQRTDTLYNSFFSRKDLDGNVTILKQEFDRYLDEKIREYYTSKKPRRLTSKERNEIKRRQISRLRKREAARRAQSHRDTMAARP